MQLRLQSTKRVEATSLAIWLARVVMRSWFLLGYAYFYGQGRLLSDLNPFDRFPKKEAKIVLIL